MRSLEFTLGLCIAVCSFFPATSAQAQIYVKVDAGGANDGTSWSDAYVNLQDALAAAANGDEIWVAAGTYKPAAIPQTFELKDNVALYGGFAGTESALGERNIAANPTILSGDIGVVGDPSDNSNHVVSVNFVSGWVLDGFEVTLGNAIINPPRNGGGMLVWGGTGTIANVTFTDNAAGEDGGALWLNDTNSAVANVVFQNNSAGITGGALHVRLNSVPTMTNLSFTSNSALRGGAVSIEDNSDPIITGASFVGNTATTWGGAIYLEAMIHLSDATFDNNSADEGGALHVRGIDPATLTGVTFSGNSARLGGAIDGGNLILTDVTFDGNSAADDGGAFHSFGGAMSWADVTFVNNTATRGGAIYLAQEIAVNAMSGVLIKDNTAATFGGGVYITPGNGGDLINVTFEGNSAWWGGGIYNEGNSTFSNLIFTGNHATLNGAGLYNNNCFPTLSNVLFFDNVSSGNGGAIFNLDSNPDLTNATFNGNSATGNGGGMSNVRGDTQITNVIMWGNSAASGPEINNSMSTPVISYSLIEASGGSGGGWDAALGTDGGNNIDADPLFVDAPGGNLRLQAGSLAIDAGDNSAPNLPATDLDGNPRIVGVAVDMGAYEFDPATGIDDVVLPNSARIRAVYPNPFNPTVTISFELERTRVVRVIIYDIRGKRVRELVSDTRPAGMHEVAWDATDDRGHAVASGVYFVRVQSHGWTEARKLMLLK
jgi:predicted outer membrane repeat protein